MAWHPPGGKTVEIDQIEPPELWSSPFFTQVVTARGGKPVFVAGQVAYDAGR
jgi:hypothetical protein